MRVSSIVLMSAAALALAACDRPADVGEEAAAGAEAAADETAGAEAPLNANAAGLPMIREGYWTVSTTNEGATVESTMCIDRGVQERMSVFGQDMTGGMCERAVIERRGDAWVSHSSCDAVPGMDMDVNMTITGDMRTRYRTEMVITNNGQPTGTPHISEGRYQGPCPAGMAPGDVVMEGGMKLNMDELAAGFAGMGQPGG